MKIGSALPRLLERKYPTVRPSYPLLTVLYLLRIQDVAAVPIKEDGDNKRAVFGFSILPKLLELTPKNFDEYLGGPCERAADVIGSFTMDDDVEKLLEAFKKRHLGVSIVNGKVRGEERTSFVSLVDLLKLYKTKQMASDMVVEEVASRIFELPGETSVRDAVETMFRLKQRRVFVSGKRMYISDRSIIDRVLSPASLVRDRGDPAAGVLDTPIDGLKMTAPIEVTAGGSMQSAALHLRSEWGPCLSIREMDAVVTPWDVVMKPWEAGRLTISARPPS